MELSKQEKKLFLILLNLKKNLLQNFFQEFKTSFENRKWNYPNKKWNHFSYFQTSDQTKYLPYLSRVQIQFYKQEMELFLLLPDLQAKNFFCKLLMSSKLVLKKEMELSKHEMELFLLLPEL